MFDINYSLWNGTSDRQLKNEEINSKLNVKIGLTEDDIFNAYILMKNYYYNYYNNGPTSNYSEEVEVYNGPVDCGCEYDDCGCDDDDEYIYEEELTEIGRHFIDNISKVVKKFPELQPFTEEENIKLGRINGGELEDALNSLIDYVHKNLSKFNLTSYNLYILNDVNGFMIDIRKKRTSAVDDTWVVYEYYDKELRDNDFITYKNALNK